MLEELIDFIQKVGFPIFVAVWLLIDNQRTRAVIDTNTKAIQAVIDTIQQCPSRENK